VKRPSQNERILEVLRDGQPHRMEEIHQRVGFCRLNSRIAELRDRGYQITCDKGGGLYVYRLIGEVEASAASGMAPCRLAGPALASTSSPTRLEHPQPAAQPQAETALLACVAACGDALADSQLSIFEAA
jgi:biotin operon repressor